MLSQVMEYNQQLKTLQIQFKNLVLRTLQRADRRASELVTEEKFGVYFHCKVSDSVRVHFNYKVKVFVLVLEYTLITGLKCYC